jgi:hypothetical protein
MMMYQACPFFGCPESFSGENWHEEMDDHLHDKHDSAIDDLPLNF